MEVNKRFSGGCFWIFMGVMAIIGFLTFPLGICIWIVQIAITYELLKG